MLTAFYCDHHKLPLPPGHRFPVAKYRAVRQCVARQLAGRVRLLEASAASDEQLLRVHDAEYLARLRRGELSALEQRRIGFPWSPEMVERSRRSTGATLDAARLALAAGVGVHLSGGTHHAFPDHGQGFCVFNDVAVAIRTLLSEQLVQRCVVIDCDVHQGNGTAFIFRDDPATFTFSMHGAHNFPFRKCAGDLDIALPAGCEDDTYLAALRHALDSQLPLGESDLAFYIAGADPYVHDRFGLLSLSKEGLAKRDALVAEACRRRRIPLAVVLGGGYAPDLNDIVEIHCRTVQVVAACYGRG